MTLVTWLCIIDVVYKGHPYLHAPLHLPFEFLNLIHIENNDSVMALLYLLAALRPYLQWNFVPSQIASRDFEKFCEKWF